MLALDFRYVVTILLSRFKRWCLRVASDLAIFKGESVYILISSPLLVIQRPQIRVTHNISVESANIPSRALHDHTLPVFKTDPIKPIHQKPNQNKMDHVIQLTHLCLHSTTTQSTHAAKT